MAEPHPLHTHEARPIRVLVVCSERVIRAALRALIDSQPGTTVIGDAEALDTALATILSDRPDVTLLDSDHDSADGVLADLLEAARTNTRILLLTGSPDSTAVSTALENGAVGLVLKQDAPEILIKAINKVHDGELWLDRSATARLLAGLTRTGQCEQRNPDAERTARLTARERQVIELVGEGLRNAQIAGRLCISEVTVRNHLTSTFRKLELSNRFQLVIYALRHGLAALPPLVSHVAPEAHRRMLSYQKMTS